MNTPDSTTGLIASLRQVADDAEALLRSSTGAVGAEVDGLRTRVTESVTTARRRLRQVEGKVTDRARIAALLTDRYVHRNPWKAIGIASAGAVLVGALLRGGSGRKPKE